MISCSIDTPVGRLLLIEEHQQLTTVLPLDNPLYQAEVQRRLALSRKGTTPLLNEAIHQLTEYFEGRRSSFSLPLCPAGTAFQLRVWQALQQIPYGETRTYAQLAKMIGMPRAVRAVGGALHRNPLPIFIPCHRVVPAHGGVGGFAWGMEVKRWLMERERE
jgi:methylated-DNA-[protein]-cysteine S-methyltransferase